MSRGWSHQTSSQQYSLIQSIQCEGFGLPGSTKQEIWGKFLAIANPESALYLNNNRIEGVYKEVFD